MADSPKTIEVSILGRSYRVSCEDGERDALMKAVAYLDEKMGEIKQSGKVSGTDRIAVMAALNIVNELLQAKGRDEGADTDLAARLKAMRERVETALVRGQHLEN